MDLRIDDDRPRGAQLVEQISDHVRSGRLVAGEQLPPVRRLATELGLAAGTVARAYRELEALGYVEGRGRAGTVVTGEGAELAARAAAHDFAGRMRELGVTPADALELVRRALG